MSGRANIKKEQPSNSKQNKCHDFSDHDYLMNNTIDDDTQYERNMGDYKDVEMHQQSEFDEHIVADEVDGNMQNISELYLMDETIHDVTVNGYEYDSNFNGRPRRNIRKPESFKVEHGSQKRKQKNTTATKRKSSTSASHPKRSKSRSSIPMEKPQYEIDYIFGKRPDRKRKGKTEYRVFWKGYTIGDSTWEPEDNLRDCQDAIITYEKQQGFHINEESLDDEGQIKTANDNGRKKGKSSGNKRQRGKSTSSAHNLEDKHVEKKQLATMRARATSIGSPTFIKFENKQKPQNNKLNLAKRKKLSPDPMRVSTPDLDYSTISPQKMVPAKLGPKRARMQPPSKGKHMEVDDIHAIREVHPSMIQGVTNALVNVTYKDGSTGVVTTEWLKEGKNLEVLLMLIDCYENMLGFSS